MGRKAGSTNVKVKTEPKYRVILRNPFEGTESSKEFPTINAISEYFKSVGEIFAPTTIQSYMVGHRPNPPLMKFENILKDPSSEVKLISKDKIVNE